MDTELLFFINQTLAQPLLDGIMVVASTVGLALLPAIGILLLLSGRRRAGVGVLVVVAASVGVAMLFQQLTLRPRPSEVRLLLSAPHFYSFPSEHAAAAFGVAAMLGLVQRRWLGWGVLGAATIALSRVYLGVHYPSDVVGGAVLGTSIGAACYGLFCRPKPEWSWLLWPQVAVVLVVTQMAYLNILPNRLLTWPLADKVLHFLLFGAVVFWLNLWLNGRTVTIGTVAIPLAIVLPLALASTEEIAQHLSPLRTADITDLTSDLAGMIFFWWLSERFCYRETPPFFEASSTGG